MKALSRVAAEFFDKAGNSIYRFTPADRLVYKDDIPEEIKDDLLFQMLVADGSIEVVETNEQRKKLENDPTEGIGADGKKLTADSAPAEEKKSGRKSGKSEKAAEEAKSAEDKKTAEEAKSAEDAGDTAQKQ